MKASIPWRQVSIEGKHSVKAGFACSPTAYSQLCLILEERRKTKYVRELRALSRAQDRLVQDYLYTRHDASQIIGKKGFQLTVGDIRTLLPGQWLNDEIINAYAELISGRSRSSSEMPRVHCFSTFFYQYLSSRGYTCVKRWGRKVQIFSLDYIIVPVHLVNHWVCLVVNFKKKRCEIYDSMKGSYDTIFKNIEGYLVQEARTRSVTFSLQGWERYQPRDIPAQTNCDDCGVFACLYMEYVSVERPMDFSASNIPYFRRRICAEILENRLME